MLSIGQSSPFSSMPDNQFRNSDLALRCILRPLSKDQLLSINITVWWRLKFDSSVTTYCLHLNFLISCPSWLEILYSYRGMRAYPSCRCSSCLWRVRLWRQWQAKKKGVRSWWMKVDWWNEFDLKGWEIPRCPIDAWCPCSNSIDRARWDSMGVLTCIRAVPGSYLHEVCGGLGNKGNNCSEVVALMKFTSHRRHPFTTSFFK